MAVTLQYDQGQWKWHEKVQLSEYVVPSCKVWHLLCLQCPRMLQHYSFRHAQMLSQLAGLMLITAKIHIFRMSWKLSAMYPKWTTWKQQQQQNNQINKGQGGRGKEANLAKNGNFLTSGLFKLVWQKDSPLDVWKKFCLQTTTATKSELFLTNTTFMQWII